MATSGQDLAIFRGIWPKLKRILLDPQRLMGLLEWLFPLWLKGGFRAIVHARKDQIASHQFAEKYTRWVQTYDQLTEEDKRAIFRRLDQIDQLPYQPLISVVMPVYNVEEKWLRKAIESVRSQLYSKWELCIADDCSPEPHVRRVLEEYQALDSRIRVQFRTINGHISEASNTALELAKGEFVALLDHDDELSQNALYWVIEELNQHPDADLIYSDEDKIDMEGFRYNPHFKSDWNPDLFYSLNLITHLAVFRTSILRAIEGFRKGYEGSQDYDLVCRVVAQTTESKIRHIPRVLYHWRAIPGSTALRSQEKNYAIHAARRAISSYLTQRGIPVQVMQGHGPLHRVQYLLPSNLPRVSIVMSVAEPMNDLRSLLKGVLRKTDYPLRLLEIILAYPESSSPQVLAGLKSISRSLKNSEVSFRPFRCLSSEFSGQNNEAAKIATGEILVFMNCSLKVFSKGWLKEMVSHALRPEIGAVGAKIYRPDETLQHAGIILGPNGIAGYAHQGYSRYLPADLGRVVCLQSVSAITADCLATRKSVFEEVGGFNQSHLARAYFDVDFCLKIRDHGYRILWSPYAEFYQVGPSHYDWEGADSGLPRFQKEKAYLQTHWATQLSHDPYYNPNLSLNPPDFTPAFPPRVQKH